MAKDMFHMVFFTSYTTLGWAGPWSGNTKTEWRKPRYWQDIGRALEGACFDAIVAEDQCFIEDVYGNSIDWYVKNGWGAVKQDPAVLMSLIGAATEHIGVVPTLNITEYPPYLLARMMSTLDHNTEGRAGWNMVTGHSAAGPRNYGADDLPPHGIRYDMAAEYADLCNALWTSWEEDALVFDKANGIFADPSKVHRLNFDGKYYKCQGPLNNSRSPQERPVMFQAGSSPAGRNFSSKYADALVGGMTGYGPMKAYRNDMRARAVAHGRNADDVKVFFQVSPILGATMEEAKAREAAMIAATRANVEAGFVVITMTAGCDLSMYPLDMPMSKIRETASTDYGKSSLEDIFNWAGDMTLGDFISFPPRWRIFQPVGTPDSVAAEMAEMMQEVGGDGFLLNIMGDTSRHGLAMVVDGLVPALQQRGVMRKEYSGKTFRENLLAF
jgi:FMN-dependent oxidoreductase (nitrilotriacetate monooxygenase family)